jgi:hypothetical protein
MVAMPNRIIKFLSLQFGYDSFWYKFFSSPSKVFGISSVPIERKTENASAARIPATLLPLAKKKMMPIRRISAVKERTMRYPMEKLTQKLSVYPSKTQAHHHGIYAASNML